MFPIIFLKYKAIIKFNLEFYDMYSITEICEQFKNISKIQLNYNRNMKIIEITLKPKTNINLKELTYEFCNHILHEQVKNI